MREPVVQGTSFGRYEIVQELAAGGMGTVYLGRQHAARGVSLTVAIKRINRALAGDPHVMGMFIDEARITALIRHPNVVQTLDVVEEGGSSSSSWSTCTGCRSRDCCRRPARAARACRSRSPRASRRTCSTGCTPPTRRRTSRGSRSTSCTATSRRRTSSSGSTASRASSTSGSRARRTGSRRRGPARSKGSSGTSPPSSSCARRSIGARTSTASASCSGR